MQLIQTITVGSGGAASIEFTNIPQDGTDLFITLSIRSAASSSSRDLRTRFNGTDTDVYSSRHLRGLGSGGVSSSTNSTGQLNFVWPSSNQGGGTTANTFASLEFYIPNYAGSSAKSVSANTVSENNADVSAIQGIHAALYNLTTAITSVSFFDTQNFAQHTTASLYKITKA